MERKPPLLADCPLDQEEINQFIEMVSEKMSEMLRPLQLVCSTGMRRIQLIRLKPNDYVNWRLTISNKKGAREKGLSEISLTIEFSTFAPVLFFCGSFRWHIIFLLLTYLEFMDSSMSCRSSRRIDLSMAW